jgi:hypothetical protein
MIQTQVSDKMLWVESAILSRVQTPLAFAGVDVSRLLLKSCKEKT